MERAKVLRVNAKNVKCISEVEIDVDGKIHEIRGDSGQGKTAILDTIKAALGGLDASMIRNGAEAAEIELQLSTATIKRIVSRESDDTLMITDAEGQQVERAKAFLQTIYSPHTFSPVRWVQLGGGDALGRTERRREQLHALLSAIPGTIAKQEVAKAIIGIYGQGHLEALGHVNLDDVDFDQNAFIVCTKFEIACYEHRSEVNAEKKSAKNALELNPAPKHPAPDESIEESAARVEESNKRFYSAQAMAQGRQTLLDRRDKLKKVVDDVGELYSKDKLEETRVKRQKQRDASAEKIVELEKALAEEREKRLECEAAINRCDEELRRVENHEARVADLAQLETELEGDAIPDLKALVEARSYAGEAYEARRLQDLHDVASKTFTQCAALSAIYTDLVAFFRDELPTARLTQAKLPVAGLEIRDGEILIHDVPLHQLGTSEQISIGVRIASALNPRSAFVLVDGAESLGRDDLKALRETALSLDLQLIMTFVDPDASPSEGVTVMSHGEKVPADEHAAA